MKEEIAYLDSSAIIKRYIYEPGSDYVGKLYLKAYNGEARLAFSIWNIGEVLGVLDRAKALGRLRPDDYVVTRSRFLSELNRMVKLRAAVVVSLRASTLRGTWDLLERRHIYQADALQVVSAKEAGASLFVTADRRLHEVASEEGLNSVYVG